MIRALLIRKIGYCFPVCSCFLFKFFFIKIDKMIAIIKLARTIEKPSLIMGRGE
jgi:hypothetical protein